MLIRYLNTFRLFIVESVKMPQKSAFSLTFYRTWISAAKGYIGALSTIFMAEFLFNIEQLLPFFFLLAIVYGSLEISKVFKNKAVNAIIAIVLGLFAVITPGVSAFILTIMPYAAVVFVIVFFIGFLKSFFVGKDEEKDYTIPVIIAGLILIFIASQGENLSRWIPSLNFLSDENFIVAII